MVRAEILLIVLGAVLLLPARQLLPLNALIVWLFFKWAVLPQLIAKKLAASRDDEQRYRIWVVAILSLITLAADRYLPVDWSLPEVEREFTAPLRAEEWLNPRELEYSEWVTGEESVLLRCRQSGIEWEDADGTDHELDCLVVEWKIPLLEGLCEGEMMEREEFQTADPQPWGAEKAYQVPGRAYYLLCFPGRIVELAMDQEPDAGQMALIGQALRE